MNGKQRKQQNEGLTLLMTINHVAMQTAEIATLLLWRCRRGRQNFSSFRMRSLGLSEPDAIQERVSIEIVDQMNRFGS